MLERCVGETLHVANDMTLATASVTSVAWTTAWANHFKMSFFYVSGVIDIIYIYKLSKKISYHNFLVRKKRIIVYKLFFFIFININFLSLYWKNLFFHIIFYTTCIIINLFIKYIKSYTFIKINSSTILFIYS